MSRRAGTAAVLFVVTVLVIAFHDLGGRNLHDVDTARWGQLAREMIRSGEWLVPTRYGELYANKPPLYLWAVAGPSQLAGEVTPLLARLPSALGLVLLVLTTAWWARLRTGSRAAGRMAGLLVLSTYLVAWLGRGARLDMMGAGLSVAAAAVLDRAALGLGTRRTPWLAGLLVGASLLTKGPPLLLVPAVVLLIPGAGRTVRERLRGARPLLVLAVGAGLALLWFIPAVLQAGWEPYGYKLLVGQAAERIGGTLAQTQPPWHYLLGLPVLAGPWGLLYVVVAFGVCVPRVRRALGPAAGLALAGTIVLLVFSAIPTKHLRYLAPAVPLFAIPLAWWLHGRLATPARGRWSAHARALAAILAVVALGHVVLGFVYRDALLPLLVPAAAFGLVARAAWAGAAGADPRRRVVLCVLYAVAFGMLSQAVIRPRVYETRKERFNARVESLRAGDVPVWIADGLTPEVVFHGAPNARYFLDPDAPVPRKDDERLLVVCWHRDAARLRDGAGRPGRVLGRTCEQGGWAIVGFGYP